MDQAGLRATIVLDLWPAGSARARLALAPCAYKRNYRHLACDVRTWTDSYRKEVHRIPNHTSQLTSQLRKSLASAPKL